MIEVQGNESVNQAVYQLQQYRMNFTHTQDRQLYMDDKAFQMYKVTCAELPLNFRDVYDSLNNSGNVDRLPRNMMEKVEFVLAFEEYIREFGSGRYVCMDLEVLAE